MISYKYNGSQEELEVGCFYYFGQLYDGIDADEIIYSGMCTFYSVGESFDISFAVSDNSVNGINPLLTLVLITKIEKCFT